MEADHHSRSQAIYLFVIISLLLVAIVAKMLGGRSSKAAQFDAWLEKTKNKEKLVGWLTVGFFFFVFGGLTLYYELTR